MSQQNSYRESLMKALDNLEFRFPGSVVIDEKTGAITLIGWRLEQFNDPENDKAAADNIKCDSRRLCCSRVSGDLAAWSTKGIRDQNFPVGVINPFADAPQSATKGNKTSCRCRVRGQYPSSVNQKHKESTCNKHFVPVVKSKFGDRIFHVLSRLMFWKE